MRSPVKKIYITQKFGVNPDAYAKFGLKGHNGIDYRAFLPNGERCYEGGKSEVFAPHDGKIIENVFDTNGYGWYVKIENDIEGSVLAHFSSQSPLKVGTSVQEGQLIGFQGTTGNSTGIHLHWGYYKKPRDRSNGYAGFINQEGLYDPWGKTMSDVYKTLDLTNKESMKAAVDIWYQVMIEKLWIKLSGLASLFATMGVKNATEAETEFTNRLDQISNLNDRLTKETSLRIELATKDDTNTKVIKSYENHITELNTQIRELQKQTGEYELKITSLESQLEDAKKEMPEQVVVQSPDYVDLFFKWLYEKLTK